MFPHSTPRRTFIGSAAAGLMVASELPWIRNLPRVTAEEAELASTLVRFDEAIEPLVQLIEETPRGKLLEKVAGRIRSGASYQEVLAALLLAGIRNVQPHPSVGFKFHCVLVVNSCHLASMAGPDEERWLPIFWALDYFKSSQADEERRSGWRMQAVNDRQVPDSQHSEKLFIEAMESWDVDKADVATAGLVRTTGAHRIFELFARYAARDYRSIGHKAIYLANAWRTLQVIGWQHAEPVLRSLAFALLNHQGDPNPAESDLAVDRPWRENGERIRDLPASWRDGRIEAKATPELFTAFRKGSPSHASETAAELLSRNVSPQSIWDGVFCGAGELIMRQPGIIGIHGLTTANAVRYLYSQVGDPQLQQRLLLQACAFNPLFREDAKGRGNLRDDHLDELEELPVPESPEAAVEEILADISQDRLRAARKLKGYLATGGSGDEFVAAARRLLFFKGRDAHDYKFASAVLEDYQHVSPAWRDRYLATSVFNLRGTGHSDSGLVERTQAAFTG